ncbi:hypothetical protein DEJ13_11505 [Curtobacterium sp. MCLR17_007]|uniref:hypothetical protein n=1 Tax=Curtobacterium sp. MCLR17_007 TaxID=2175648 RepID=UPI000DA8334D|nr:hypothetical protein [Curtobacterium sp. MCLR17_007]WIB59081.1 hypothetical protein DEJ13_11505 [Curtobacterium sp. MCLR17_007]
MNVPSDIRPAAAPSRRRPRAWIAMLTAVVAVAAALSAFTVVTDDQPASAATASGFDPGNIISDANFYNANALTAAQVQYFLDQKVPTCRSGSGPACLRNYTQNTRAIGAVAGRCSAIGGGTMTGAQIIDGVARACNISQKVLLVLLEKEQGLITSSAPSSYKYTHATGFACPDTAPCDPAYNGFFAQVYAAGLQFQRYKASPNSWGYQAGRTNTILYNPSASCGTKQVYIQNQATAALYIYTPYVPNQAAMNNLYGTGDGCSAYGNRNFWRMYTDWFGSTTGGNAPNGAITGVSTGYRQAVVTGWAVDPDTTDPIRTDFYVDGKGAASTMADVATSSLANTLGANNTRHGFSATLTGLSAGSHQVCAWGINAGAGSNAQFQCADFTIEGGNPVGVIDQVSNAIDTVSVRGWAIDPDTTAAVTVRVQIDGVTKATWTANATKTGLNAAKPGFGDAHQYSGTITGVAPGNHQLCVVATNAAGSGSDATLGCQSFTRQTGSPNLNVDQAVSKSPGTMTIRGWSIDPDTAASVRVDAYVDGTRVKGRKADMPKASLATAFPGYGANHQFSMSVSGLTPSVPHELCLAALDAVGGNGATWQCMTVAQPTGDPVVTIEQAKATAIGTLSVSGFAVDPDMVTPVAVSFTVDGTAAGSTVAKADSAAAASRYPGYGSAHGFTATLPNVGPGQHTVCITAKNAGGGKDGTSCQNVSMLSGSPSLNIDEASSRTAGSITMRGWAVDPDTTAPVRIDTYVDDIGRSSIQANGTKASLATAFGTAYGAAHQFSQTLTGFTAGTHQVCTWAINTGAGSNVQVCSTVTVK